MPTITFKVSHEEARVIRARARASKAPSISEFLRKIALQESAPQKRVLVKDKLTGLLVDATPGPIVSDEEVRSALADLP